MQGQHEQAADETRRASAGQAGRLPTGLLDAATLGACEREIFTRFADANGHVGDSDIDTLLRHNLLLRRLIADLVASAGRPRAAANGDGYVADVPTQIIEQVGQHGDFTHIEDTEAVGPNWC